MSFDLPPYYVDRYRPIEAAGMRGLADTAFWDGLSEAMRADPAALLTLPGAERVKESRNILARAEIGEGAERRSIWIKRFRPRGVLSWAQRAGRAGKAERGWNTAFALLEAGIDTPRPLLGMRGAGRLGGAHGLLVVEHAAGDPLRGLLRGLEPDSVERIRLVHGLGGFIGRLHAKGFVHRDLSGGNILVQWTPDGEAPPQFRLIDINRMRRRPELTVHMRLRDLERVRLRRADHHEFFTAYETEGAAPPGLRAACNERVKRYRRMRETTSPLVRVWLKARYYWDDLRG